MVAVMKEFTKIPTGDITEDKWKEMFTSIPEFLQMRHGYLYCFIPNTVALAFSPNLI